MKSKFKEYLIRSFMLFLSLLIGYLIIESGLRLLFFQSIRWPGVHYQPMLIKPDPDVGWILQPNQVAYRESLDFRVVLEVNSEGMRDREYPFDKEPGVFRIALLGDSFMEASHVDESDAFFYVLETLLRERGFNVEVLNFGVAAYGSAQSRIRLERDALRYDPDLILYGFFGENDLVENHRELTKQLWGADDWRTFARPYAHLNENDELVISPPDYDKAREEFEAHMQRKMPFFMRIPFFDQSVTSQTYRQIRRSFQQRVFMPGHDPNISLGSHLLNYEPAFRRDKDMTEGMYRQYWAEARAINDVVLSEMHRITIENNILLALFTVPSKVQVEPGYQERVYSMYPGLEFDWQLTEKTIIALADAYGFPALNLVPAFQEEYMESNIMLHYFRADTHWNPLGHRFAASCVADWLIEQELVN